jgi:CRP/FNR family cyclic AMP-dependent transcriptional regulator
LGYYRAGMPDRLLQRFTRTYSPGDVICREGDRGDEMYIIQRGKVRVDKRFGRKTQVVSVLEKGDFFGEMAIVNAVQRTATVTAIDNVELLVFDRTGLQDMIARNALIGLNIIDRLCRRLQSAHLKILHLVKRDARGLIALHLRCLFQELPAGPLAVPADGCLEEVSASLELPMEEVRSAFAQLEADGILAVTPDSVTLTDQRRLWRMTEAVGREPEDPSSG